MEECRELLLSLLALLRVRLGLEEEKCSYLREMIKGAQEPQDLKLIRDEFALLLELSPEVESSEISKDLSTLLDHLCEVVGVDPLEMPTPRTLDEALERINELVTQAHENLKCLDVNTLNLLKDSVVRVLENLKLDKDIEDINDVIDLTIKRIKEDELALYEQNILRRVENIARDRKRLEAIERKKLNESIKQILSLVAEGIKSLDSGESKFSKEMDLHLQELEDTIQLENLEDMVKSLVVLSKGMRKTIESMKQELANAKKELNNSVAKLNEMKKELEFYREISSVDELTGLLNRRALDAELNRELERSFRYGSIFSVAIIDVDHFKNINDTYGHVVGDKVLASLAKILRSRSRKVDIVARYGGEEFCIVYPDTTGEQAFEAVEKVRETVENHKFMLKGTRLPVTFSAGVTQAAPDDTVEELLARADKALYISKESGRNRTHLLKKGE